MDHLALEPRGVQIRCTFRIVFWVSQRMNVGTSKIIDLALRRVLADEQWEIDTSLTYLFWVLTKLMVLAPQ